MTDLDWPVDCPECGWRQYLALPADEEPAAFSCSRCGFTDEVTLHLDDPSWLTWQKEATDVPRDTQP